MPRFGRWWPALVLAGLLWAAIFLTGRPGLAFVILVGACITIYGLAEVIARVIIAVTRCRQASPLDKREKCVMRRGHPGLHESRSLMWGAPPGWRSGPLPHAAAHETRPDEFVRGDGERKRPAPGEPLYDAWMGRQ